MAFTDSKKCEFSGTRVSTNYYCYLIFDANNTAPALPGLYRSGNLASFSQNKNLKKSSPNTPISICKFNLVPKRYPLA